MPYKGIDLTGKRFGKLLVIALTTERDAEGVRKWSCRCDCGCDLLVTGFQLRGSSRMHGYKKTNCGCVGKIGRYTGRRFGKLVVLGHGVKNPGAWLLKCDCGKEFERQSYFFRCGASHCGCKGRAGWPCGVKHKGYKGFGELSGNVWSRIKGSARRRNLPFELTIEYAWQLFLDQNRRCKFTGVELIIGSVNAKRSQDTASLDRKDSSVGYLIGNVQWVHKQINVMKGALSDAEFIEWCQKVTRNSPLTNGAGDGIVRSTDSDQRT